MQLKDFIPNVKKEFGKIFFSGISFDSSKVKKNDIFFAIKGNKFDGNKFIPHAIKNGSRIIVSENKSDKYKNGILFINKKNIRKLLAEVSSNIIDQCVAQGVPFAREYGGTLDNRSFGGVQVSRTFYARGQTGQQLLLGAYSALSRQISKGTVQMYNRHEMLDVVMIDGVARGIIARNLLTGQYERYFGHAVVLATGGYGNVFYLSTNAMGSNVTAAWKAYKRGAMFGNPCFTQIHPTCIPVSGDYQSKLTLMSESLRNDGRIWVPLKKGDSRLPEDIPEDERDYYLERKYPAFGNLVPRDIASRAAKERCDEGYGVGQTKMAVYLDFKDAINNLGEDTVRSRYGNLFQMYNKITGEDVTKYVIGLLEGLITQDEFEELSILQHKINTTTKRYYNKL